MLSVHKLYTRDDRRIEVEQDARRAGMPQFVTATVAGLYNI